MDGKEETGSADSREKWFFAGCEYEETTHLLRVGPRQQDLTGQNGTLLEAFLNSGHRVMTREELTQALWPNVEVTPNSLDQALTRLRRALEGSTAPVFVNVPNRGYKLAVPVRRGRRFSESEPVPGRAHWVFFQQLGGDFENPVWLTRHEKTGELHVMKFAMSRERMQSLRTEVAVSRLLRQTLGERDEFVPVQEMNLDEPPLFVETRYYGQNLREWAMGDSHQPGHVRETALPVRLRMMADLARAIALAHGKEILHRDLKPGNVLVLGLDEGKPAVRVADFGVASIENHAELAALDITDPGQAASRLNGSSLYIAPEVRSGGESTARSDVYALGVMLYQMVVGDFDRPLAPGWEATVEDPVLRLDIGDAACLDPDKRTMSAGDLADRLIALEERRTAFEKAKLAEQEAAEAKQRLERVAARRPWVLALIVALVGASTVSFALYRRAARDRDSAQRMEQFLSRDLLAQANPLIDNTNETLVAAVEHAAAGIDRNFPEDPLIAAELHGQIAVALNMRNVHREAAFEYSHAAALYHRAQGPYSQSAIQCELQLAAMQALRIDPGPMAEARSVYEQQETLLRHVRRPSPDTLILEAIAYGSILTNGDHSKAAVAVLMSALAAAQQHPPVNSTYLTTLELTLTHAYARLGEGQEAIAILKPMVETATREHGPESWQALAYSADLVQAEMAAGQLQPSIDLANQLAPRVAATIGKNSTVYVVLIAARSQAEGGLMQWKSAIADDMAIHAWAAGVGANAFMSIASLADAGLSACRAGDYTTGEQYSEEALRTQKAKMPTNRGVEGTIQFALATCYAGEGRAAQAEAALRAVDIPATEQLAGDADWKADYALVQAQIALKQQDATQAGALLQAAAPACVKPSAELYRATFYETLARRLPHT